MPGRSEAEECKGDYSIGTGGRKPCRLRAQERGWQKQRLGSDTRHNEEET